MSVNKKIIKIIIVAVTGILLFSGYFLFTDMSTADKHITDWDMPEGSRIDGQWRQDVVIGFEDGTSQAMSETDEIDQLAVIKLGTQWVYDMKWELTTKCLEIPTGENYAYVEVDTYDQGTFYLEVKVHNTANTITVFEDDIYPEDVYYDNIITIQVGNPVFTTIFPYQLLLSWGGGYYTYYLFDGYPFGDYIIDFVPQGQIYIRGKEAGMFPEYGDWEPIDAPPVWTSITVTWDNTNPDFPGKPVRWVYGTDWIMG